MKDTDNTTITPEKRQKTEQLRKKLELIASFGLIIICVGLLVPLFNLTNMDTLRAFKWVYSAGALVYLLARVVNASDPDEPVRMRRMRRMEFWAGIAFAIGAGFWFYKEAHLGVYAGPLAVIKDTILFALAGAAIQIIASWLIYYASKKKREL